MNGCWLWTGRVNHKGYGVVYIDGREQKAHKRFYEAVKGLVPDGMVLDHLCRTPACVNPDHLEIVTPAENTRRGEGPSAVNGRKKKCVNGHALSGANLHVRPDGSRRCRACEAARMRRRRAA